MKKFDKIKLEMAYVIYHAIVILIAMRIYIYIFKSRLPQIQLCLKNRHVVITGGSSGIGKSIALLLAKNGANVTILARNLENLLETIKEMKKVALNSEQIFKNISLDCSDWAQCEELLGDLDNLKPVYMLVNCAGVAIPGTLEDLSPTDIKKMINVNVLGCIYPVKALIGNMKKRREGIILLTGSQCSLFGLYGYTGYAASKFALRGFAESLDMEVRDYNIKVTLALPPDTKTPGYEEENKEKPIETKLISEFGGLYRAEDVAVKMVKDALDCKFFSCMGVSGYFSSTLCVGFAPVKVSLEFIWGCLTLGLHRFIAAIYLLLFYRIITKCRNKRIHA